MESNKITNLLAEPWKRLPRACQVAVAAAMAACISIGGEKPKINTEPPPHNYPVYNQPPQNKGSGSAATTNSSAIPIEITPDANPASYYHAPGEQFQFGVENPGLHGLIVWQTDGGTVSPTYGPTTTLTVNGTKQETRIWATDAGTLGTATTNFTERFVVKCNHGTFGANIINHLVPIRGHADFPARIQVTVPSCPLTQSNDVAWVSIVARSRYEDYVFTEDYEHVANAVAPTPVHAKGGKTFTLEWNGMSEVDLPGWEDVLSNNLFTEYPKKPIIPYFPPINAGTTIPPPFVTLVVKYRFDDNADKDAPGIHEIKLDLHVTEVIELVYKDDLVPVFTSDVYKEYPMKGKTKSERLYIACSQTEAQKQISKIADYANEWIGDEVNVLYTIKNDKEISKVIGFFYKQIIIKNGVSSVDPYILGDSLFNARNSKRDLVGNVYMGGIINVIIEDYQIGIDYPDYHFNAGIVAENLARIISFVSIHESAGHMLGLVDPKYTYTYDDDNLLQKNHNVSSTGRREHVMDAGGLKTPHMIKSPGLIKIGLNKWLEINYNYLKWLLRKPAKQD